MVIPARLLQSTSPKKRSDDLYSHRRTGKKTLTRHPHKTCISQQKRDSSKDGRSALSLGSSSSRKRSTSIVLIFLVRGDVVLILTRQPVQQTLLTHNARATQSVSQSNFCHKFNVRHKHLQHSILTDRERSHPTQSDMLEPPCTIRLRVRTP